MNRQPATLDRVQRWMQAVITHPLGVTAGLESEAAHQHLDVAAPDIEHVIARSQAMTSLQRLEVYANAYYARLVGCMAAEFPATRQSVGEEAFSGFVIGFLQEHPSQSYTLSDLGAGFPAYLSNSRPPREGDFPDWGDFIVDVATLERVYGEVFDGPGEEKLELLTADDLRTIPTEQWGQVRLTTAPSLRLIELQFPAHDYVTAVRRGEEDLAIPEPDATRLAISRRDYIVRRRALQQIPYDLLRGLQEGATLDAAIGTAVETMDEPPSDLADRLQEWFRRWTAEGYFVAASV